MNKSKLAAFLFSFIPGFGHMYVGNVLLGILYFLLCSGALVGGVGLSIITFDDVGFFFGVIAAIAIYIINFLHILVWMVTARQPAMNPLDTQELNPAYVTKDEKLQTILLSIIPGLGHLFLQLKYRALSFLVTFFGVMMTVFFLIVFVDEGAFLLFLFLLPMIWLVALFDAVQLYDARKRGELIEDRMFFDDLQRHVESGEKSKMIAMICAIFPGVGHLYLGLKRRGLQFMGLFLLSLYLLDAMNITFFLFIVPMIWFYSFFDVSQKANDMTHYALEMLDKPLVDWVIDHQKWVGIALVLFGLFFIFNELVIDVMWDRYPDVARWLRYNLQELIVAVLLLFGGLKLLVGNRKRTKTTYM
ncbi:hypothetical protein [Longirhabdus pacifica]|uniref:hypothetical protein n=1 Tax=Longirhabdus pacifica TaxID=2305227 RepID=UPI001008D05D|nr:hypothetical protein [Longirhabdus pacifica]